MNIRFIFILNIFILVLIAFGYPANGLNSKDTTTPLTIKADYATYTDEDKTAYARGKVRVTYGADTLYADEIWFTMSTRYLHAKGHVKLTRGMYGKSTVTRLDCDELKYEIDTYRGIATNIYSTIPPWFIHAPEFEQLNRFEQHAREPSFTTCDRPQPHYHLSAREITIYPEKNLIAKDVVFYFKNTPIFYYPVYCRGLQKRESNFHIIPGHNSRLGAFIKSTYSFSWSEYMTTRLLLDYYSKQGLGTGLEAEYSVSSVHQGRLASYYINERKTDEQRDRIYFRHRSILTDKLSVLAYANYASDPEFDQDYIWKYVRGKLDTRESFLSIQNLDDNNAIRLTLHRLDEALENEIGAKEFQMTEQQTPQLEFNTKYRKLGSFPAYFLWQSSIGQDKHPGPNLIGNADNYTSTDAESDAELITSFPITENISFTPSIGIENDWSSKTVTTAIYDEFQSRLDSETLLQIRNNKYMKTEIFWRSLYRLDDPENTKLTRMEANYLGTRIAYRFPKTKLRVIWNTSYSLKDDEHATDNELRYSTRLDTSWQPQNNLTFFANGELLNQFIDDSGGNQDNVTGQTWFASVNFHPKSWWWVSLGTKYQKLKYSNETLGTSTESIAFFPAFGTNLGKNWKLQVGAGYEIGKAENANQTTQSIYKQVMLIRDLHCWEAYLRYQNWEEGNSWWFALNLKAFPIQHLGFDEKAGFF